MGTFLDDTDVAFNFSNVFDAAGVFIATFRIWSDTFANLLSIKIV
jgi:hypothetical protein